MVKITKTSYAWTKEDEAMLIEYDNENPRQRKSGSFCTFIPYTLNIGVKLYTILSERDGALKNQMIAHHYNVGPKCGTPFEIILNDVPRFGYLTEIAEPMSISLWNDISYDMKKKYEDLGFLFRDWWVTNVGVLNNKPVVIDFDPYYFMCNDNNIEIA